MTGEAIIRVRDRPGVFVADSAAIDDTWVHASGRWRSRLATGDRFSDERSYTWSSVEIRSIRWGVAS